jgi:hypothetical protein
MSLREAGERLDGTAPASCSLSLGVGVAGGEEGDGVVVCSSPAGEDEDATGWGSVDGLPSSQS